MLLENGPGSASPIAFEMVLRNQGFGTQPNEFLSAQNITERQNAGCTCFDCPVQPPLDPTNSCSPTWDALYAIDQTISRSRFDVEHLDALPQAIKNEAIRRLQLPDDDIQKMPPVRFHTLSDAQIQMVIDELSP